MSEDFCSSCGEKITIEGKFCSSCGNPLMKKQQVTTGINEQEALKDKPVNQTNKHLIYIGFAIIIAIFAYNFFTKSTPEKVAKEFVESIYEMDIENAAGLLASSIDDDIVEQFEWMLEDLRENPEDSKEELREMKRDGYVLKDFIIRDKIQTKDFASLEIEMTFKNGDEDTGYIELVKESGKWKIHFLE